MKKFFILSIFSVLFNCASTELIEKKTFQNLVTPSGEPRYYQTTNITDIHLFGVYPIIQNAKFESALEEFSKQAKKNKTEKMQIIQKETYKYYLVYFPISIIFTPVATEVVGEVY